jgi:hypothetical protein
VPDSEPDGLLEDVYKRDIPINLQFGSLPSAGLAFEDFALSISAAPLATLFLFFAGLAPFLGVAPAAGLGFSLQQSDTVVKETSAYHSVETV